MTVWHLLENRFKNGSSKKIKIRAHTDLCHSREKTQKEAQERIYQADEIVCDGDRYRHSKDLGNAFNNSHFATSILDAMASIL